jgi:AraC family transcriptional regulator of adaptative response / DNA-3-methyladenine glycosylase II
MPLLARLRHLLDLDAEPSAVDAHLERSGLGALVRRLPGLRVPGALDGFEAALRVLLGGPGPGQRVVLALGDPIATGMPGLERVAPGAGRLAGSSASELAALGVPRRRAEAVIAVARALAAGTLRLEPGSDVVQALRALRGIAGMDDRSATAIVTRALHWPDAFSASDRRLQRAAGVSGARELRAGAERWRPWRAYAAQHLLLQEDADG